MAVPGAWYAFSAAAVLGAVAATGVRYLAKTRVEPAIVRNATTQLRYLGEYLDDLDFVAPEAFFKASRQGSERAGAKDASELLNAAVQWLPSAAAYPPPKQSLLSAETRDVLLRLRNDWIDHPGKFTMLKVDFGLFEKARAFDYWDIEKRGPLASLVKERRFVPPPMLPLPDASELEELVQIRLIKALDEKLESTDRIEALKDARQMAKLLFSTENLDLKLAGLAILDYERRAYHRYVEEGLLDENEWQPIDRNVSRRAARAIWGSRGYLRLLTPADAFTKALLDEKRVVIGLCAAAKRSVSDRVEHQAAARRKMVARRRGFFRKLRALIGGVDAREKRVPCQLPSRDF